jgi:hypothetical protein
MNELSAGASPGCTTRELGVEDNRRIYPRHACRYQALCRSAGRAWWPVVFRDVSRSGAGVALSSPIEVGAAVNFTVYLTNGRVMSIAAIVRRVEDRNFEWLAGCEFNRVLSDADMAELL